MAGESKTTTDRFQPFEENRPAFVHHEETNEGDASRYSKLVERQEARWRRTTGRP